MSSGSNFSNSSSPVAPASSKQMTQANLRLKALTQLRQVLRASPGRVGIAYSVGKDLLILLRYLPAGIINKIQNFSSSGEFYSASSSSSSDSSSGKGPDSTDVTENSSRTHSSAPPTPTHNKRGNKKDDPKTQQSRFKFLSMSLPSTPTKTSTLSASKIEKSVLENVLQMRTENNSIIGHSAKYSTTKDAASVAAEAAAAIQGPEKEGEPKIPVKEIPGPTFAEMTESWQAIEAKTKLLVANIAKALKSSNDPSHNLIHRLDEFYTHIFHYSSTRTAARDAGAVKILSKVMRRYPHHTYVLGKGRELIALLGVPPPIKGRGINILSIDGGGVRGLAAVEVLRALERVTNKKTHELFDYICGVSTGAIIGFLVGAHRHSLDVAENMYKDLSREIFSQSSFWGSATMVWSHAYYHTPTFEKILKKHCGEVPLISLARHPELPRISAISTVVNQERVVPHVFRTYAFHPSVKAKYGGSCRHLMWEAVRASAAAPTYFEEFKLGNLLHQDGGIIVNNPAAVAIGEAKTLWTNTPIQSVVSIGTGLTLSSKIDKTLGDFIEQTESGENYLSWKGKFLKVLDSATDTETVHNTLNELLSPDVYFRFNPYLSEVVKLDETNPEILDRIQLETRRYLERNILKVEYVGKALTKQKTLGRKVSEWWQQ